MVVYVGRFFKEFGKGISESYKQNYMDAKVVLDEHFIFHELVIHDFAIDGKERSRLEKTFSDACVYGTYHIIATIGTAIKVPRITGTSFKKSFIKESLSDGATPGLQP